MRKRGVIPFAAIPTAVIQSLLHKTDIARAEISLHALESAGDRSYATVENRKSKGIESYMGGKTLCLSHFGYTS
jgi:hypothetical protein